MSACSALHENTVFPGQEGDGGFGFFPSMPDGEGDGEWITADIIDNIDLDDEEEEEGGEGEGGEGGRVRSDFHSGGGPGARFRPY